MIRPKMRVIGLAAGITWISASGIAEAVNNTIGTAVQAVLGEKRSQMLDPGAVGYYGYYLYPDRSYVALCWPASYESSATISDSCSLDFRNIGDVVLAAGFGNISFEPFPKGGKIATLTPTGDSLFFVRVVNTTAVPAQTATINLIVMETTLASPWYFVNPAAGYESYVEIRNQSVGATMVTIRAYNSTGTLVGSMTVQLAGNGNTFFRVGVDLHAPAGSGSVTITHLGMPGTVVANTTTLSGMTGLSFDSPFTPRIDGSVF
jgi:hypothetical protein